MVAGEEAAAAGSSAAATDTDPTSMNAGFFQFDEFKQHDRVKVIKDGNNMGEEGVVLDPDWSGRIKVDINGKVKSYEVYEIRNLTRGGPGGPRPSNGVWPGKARSASMVAKESIVNQLNTFSAVSHIGAEKKTLLAAQLNARPEEALQNAHKKKTHEGMRDPKVGNGVFCFVFLVRSNRQLCLRSWPRWQAKWPRSGNMTSCLRKKNTTSCTCTRQK
jgi:hypothetical protein